MGFHQRFENIFEKKGIPEEEKTLNDSSAEEAIKKADANELAREDISKETGFILNSAEESTFEQITEAYNKKEKELHEQILQLTEYISAKEEKERLTALANKTVREAGIYSPEFLHENTTQVMGLVNIITEFEKNTSIPREKLEHAKEELEKLKNIAHMLVEVRNKVETQFNRKEDDQFEKPSLN